MPDIRPDHTPVHEKPTLASMAHAVRAMEAQWDDMDTWQRRAVSWKDALSERLEIVERHAHDDEAHPTRFAIFEARLTQIHADLLQAIALSDQHETDALREITTKLHSFDLVMKTAAEDAAHRQARLRDIVTAQQTAKEAAEQAKRVAEAARLEQAATRLEMVGLFKTNANRVITLLLSLLSPLVLGVLQPNHGTGSTPNKPLELVVVGVAIFAAMQFAPLLVKYARQGIRARRASHAAKATYTIPDTIDLDANGTTEEVTPHDSSPTPPTP